MGKMIAVKADCTSLFKDAMNSALDLFEKNGQVYIAYSSEPIETKNKYSTKQRGALHVWLQMIADLFNEAGMEYGSRVKFNGEQVKIPWDMSKVKEDIYKPLLESMTGKQSTEDQSSIDSSLVARQITLIFGERYGIPLPPWPSNR